MGPSTPALVTIVAVWAFLLLTSHVSPGAAGVQLDGAGSSNSAGILAAWAHAYRYTRDDVRINYSQPGLQVALTQYSQGIVDFLATDRGVFGNDFSNLIQLPLAAQAMAMGYNIPSLHSSDPALIMNRTVLAAIWAGEITMWDDTAIRELNPALVGKLPSEPIAVGYIDSTITISFVEVLKKTLESFSDDFRVAFAAANRTFGKLPGAASGGTLKLISGSSPARAAWMMQTNYSMTFLNFAETVGQVPLMRMYNKAGTLVDPSVASVQSAMADFEAYYDNGEFTVDILDANGTNSWPMAYLTFLSMDFNGSYADCTNVQELLNFVSWIDTNDEASSTAIAANVAPLDIGLRKKLINQLNGVQCNGQQAFTKAFLVGVGAELSLITSWSVSWSADQSKLKYYQETSTVAKEQLVQYNSDFGVSVNALTDGWVQQMSDVGQIPAAAFALAPGYNIPELAGNYLVLDCETLAAIYLNSITMWNDSRIKSINSPVVAALLPAQPIVVVTLSESSAITQLFTYMLNATVPSFAAQVGVGGLPHFPVLDAFNRSLTASDGVGLTSLLRSTTYSIATWMHQPLLQSRSLGVASMINPANKTVRASMTSVASAMNDFLQSGTPLAYTSLVLGKGEASWPLATFASIIYRQKSMNDCSDAQALADFLWWSQFDPNAEQVAISQNYVLASSIARAKSYFLRLMKNFTCDGVAASSYAGCINDGMLCSDQGTCTDGVCQCNSGRTGQYCDQLSQSRISDDQLVAILLGTIIPLAFCCCLLLVGAIIWAGYLSRARKRGEDDWEIRYDELEVGAHLGTGGFGEVYRATWKGTEVAVKVMLAERVTKDMARRFKDEVRVMTALRHPNVVLFMAASTKAPKMCIVMEYMALGCLFDLLHNELIPELPFALKAKMAYQASKGMHFLHSSGIVHRDLKSLNLLLDTKWNVKVSDFGLTKFKEDIGKGAERDIGGSVHWTAPEILNESADVDYILADVYSFGIILWELLTREQPYFGLSPSAVAISVIRDGLRPHMPHNLGGWPAEYDELITSCWHHDTTIRPTFLEIMTRLSTMHGGSTSAGVTTYTSKTSSSSGHSGLANIPKRNSFGSWTLPSATNSSVGSSHSSRNSLAAAPMTGKDVRPPEGEVTIVFTDITRAASLWEFNAAAMRDATLLHNDILRRALQKHRGYEVVFIKDKNSGEGSFCMAFQHSTDALAWCSEVQQVLLAAFWPEELLEHPGAAEEWGDTDNRVMFKGLRVRMGVHVGTPRMVRDPMTRRMEYIGPVVNAAARITALTHGGQIVMSQATYVRVKNDLAAQGKVILGLGRFETPDHPRGSKLYELKIAGLEGRFFGGVAIDNLDHEADRSTSTRASSNRSTISGASSAGSEVQTVVGEGMMFKEDTFLTSANLCRWIIDFAEIQVGRQVGLGSYGTVYHGRWKGVEVAVKRFIKQKLDERRMLEFRAEMAFLSELHHPNIVLFIGACVKKPNLCIVTEFMKQGSLKDILTDSSIKLTWQHKLQMLRRAALGINYLHSLHPIIVHRDLKPSNLLVDENWNVKVADFGFARIKEENATMTRCGTPCWTAPEVIRGDKYDERADVFSFGVVMWQVLTRKEPFAGRNFMGVSLDVLEGKRPQIPNDCPPEFTKMLKRCWHASPGKRPHMDDVLAFLDGLIAGDEEDDTYQPSVV